MKEIKVILENRTYSIKIGSNIICNKMVCQSLIQDCPTILITNQTIFSIFNKKIVVYLKKINMLTHQFVIPDGEKYKNIYQIEMIITFLLKNHCGRNSILIALGGGVIGDITGFVASIYQRGINFIQIPTTLLSQVDASIGGKTGINHILGKNMIGTFWQPNTVLIDIDFLTTLPYRELQSGLSEVIKYAIIFDKEFFIWLESNIESLLLLKKDIVLYCIYKCCYFKSKLVSHDERENNLRALLNLGHTYGHAIEAYLGYGKWLHGEAISAGIVMAAYTSNILGYLDKKDIYRIVNLFKKVGLPIKGPDSMLESSYISFMLRDKKTISGMINLVLPVHIGCTQIFSKIDKKLVVLAIKNTNQENFNN